MQLALLVFIDVKFFKFGINPTFRSGVRLGMGDRAEYGSLTGHGNWATLTKQGWLLKEFRP